MDESNLARLLDGDEELISAIKWLLNDEVRPRKVRSAFGSRIEQGEDKDEEISL